MDNPIQTEKISLPDGDEWISKVRENAFKNMKRYDGCARVIVDALLKEWGLHDPMAAAPKKLLLF